uniref:Zgc:92429 n=1 Tax=Amphiprion percula TaxID=161767 RepID=A0A3P8TD02_AMPPE
MALLCYNKGCGEKFDANKNQEDSCIFHPGVPIFHDALKGWSCCKKRTTDFSEFLSIKGCTRGCHSNEKPQEPLRPEVSSDKGEIRPTNSLEIIYQGPKSAETLQKERPSSDEPLTKLPHKVSASLVQALEKLDISKRAENENKGQKINLLKLVFHFLRKLVKISAFRYKYWSCCCIKTTDFNAFLDQKGCSSGKHRWVPKQDKKKVACRYDWHQTGNNVFVTIYAKNANPELSNLVSIQFENNKIFKREFHLWGVSDHMKQSSVNMVPSKVEISLRKADPVSWGKLEDPNYKPEPEPVEDTFAETETYQPNWDIEDDDISDSDEDWTYDTPQNKPRNNEEKLEEQRLQEEQEGFEDIK